MKVTVCIGSSCHIKGSRQVVEQLQYLIKENNLGDKVELGGTFCMGKCQQGVCVTIDDNFYSVTPETVEEFFNKNSIDVAVLTLPRSLTTKMADKLAKYNVRGIWNLTNTEILPSDNGVVIENVHLSDSLLSMGYYLKKEKAKEGEK